MHWFNQIIFNKLLFFHLLKISLVANMIKYILLVMKNDFCHIVNIVFFFSSGCIIIFKV